MSLQTGFEGQSVFFTNLWNRPNTAQGKLALPESSDERILKAADYLLKEDKLAELWLFSDKLDTIEQAQQLGIDLENFSSKIIWTREKYQGLPETARKQILNQIRIKGKTIAAEVLKERSQSSLFHAGCLLKDSFVDAVVAGSQAATADVLRAVIGTSGLKVGYKALSGAMLMEQTVKNDMKLYADMAVIPDPNQEQIVDIAKSSVAIWEALLPAEPPRVAFLSFSTKGSASSPSSEKMLAAASDFKKQFPEVICDGEIQFDAAVSAEVRQRKIPDSSLTDDANIFIFPNLDAGNIGYKMTQRLGGYNAIGPILQGTARPFFDLSRGATVEDIVKTSIIALCLKS